MIKLKNLLNESTPGFDKREFGDALPTLASVTAAHQAKLKLTELIKEESFTAINKETGKVSVFKSKEARDSAVKAGSHDKKEDDAEKGGDTPASKEKPNMFSKDTGYDVPDSPKEEPKSEPTKDSTQKRAGNTEVNKSVRSKAKKLGITPAKLGKEEYQKAMGAAAYEALTDSNFHSEARQLLAVLTGDEKLAEKPDYPSMSDDDFDTKIDKIRKDRESGDIYTTPENDSYSELGQHSSSESSWSGADAIDAIAFDLKMNGYKDLAAKIQSVIKED